MGVGRVLVEELQYARDDARVGQQALVSEPARLVQLRAAHRVHTLTRGETEIGTVAHVTPTP